MKPIIILPPGAVSKEDIDRLRENDLCVVEAAEPALVKFVDPIPCISSRTQIEDAAIQLSRRVMSRDFWANGPLSESRAHCVRSFVEFLVAGTPLDPNPSQQELEREVFNFAKADELRRLAREEAKAERAAAKAAKKKADESATNAKEKKS